MKNSELIFKNNKGFVKTITYSNIYISNAKIIIRIDNVELNHSTIINIIQSINYVDFKYPNNPLPIKLLFTHIIIMDKLSFVILECLIQSLIEDYNKNVELSINSEKIIISHGILSSPLHILTNLQKPIEERNEKFSKKFEFDYYRQHFRRVLKYEDYIGTDKLCKIYDDVAYFQKSFNINYDCIEEISEVIIELLGNAIEHSKSDCLVDFDIAPNYRTLDGQRVCGINIAILNFSKKLLGDGIKNKVTTHRYSEANSKNYQLVENAFATHSVFFNYDYNEEDFFNISTFQNKITEREKNSATGGTGLTKLIKSIEDKADNHECYVVSGNRMIIFYPDYLEYKDNWIGFNKDNDYFNKIPDKEIIKKSNFYMPGTAYNLNFIMKVNDYDE